MSTSIETLGKKFGEVSTHPIETSKHILHWDELPHWMQVDPYIRRGYRRQLHSIAASFWSLFYPHNELVNIWSHLLPACFYLSALLGVDWELFGRELEARQVRWEDKAMIQIYVGGTVICLLASVCGSLNPHLEWVTLTHPGFLPRYQRALGSHGPAASETRLCWNLL